MHISLHLSMLSCPGMPGDFTVLLVTLDKLVRLRKRIRSLTSVAYCSFVCVFGFLLACLFVFVRFSSMTDGEGELCTLLPLCVYCLLNGVVTCHHTPH